MLKLGLTGGLGSGKSEAARFFRDAGIPVLNADELGHAVLAPGGTAEAEVLAEFGDEILSNGIIDRTKLGYVVFQNDKARQKLNQITHPKIRDAILSESAQLEKAGHPAVIVEAALWGEDDTLPDWMDELILVLSPKAVRIERVMSSRGMTEEEAKRRIAAQRPPEEKRILAAFVINNNDDLDSLKKQVNELAKVVYGRFKCT